MELEFDHFFVFTEPDAPQIDQLCQLGLIEGTANVHPGQGTANRRIFFQNAMLECLWIVDEAEVKSEPIAGTRLWERSQFRQTGFSPFGIALRPAKSASQEAPLPFETWDFRPPYLPPTLKIDVASHTAAEEPLIFVIPFGRRPADLPADRAQPLSHPLGLKEITRVQITLPTSTPPSPGASALEGLGLVSFVQGTEFLADIEFDHAVQGEQIDFRPDLPLCLRW